MVFAKLRFLIILVFILLGIILTFVYSIGTSWYLFLAAFLLGISHFKFGNVTMAFFQLKKGNLDAAEELLGMIKRPDWLTQGHQAYYHFTRGMIALQKKYLDLGEEELQKALSLGLKNNTDKALANLNLAHIAYVQKRPDDSNNYLSKAKSFETNDLMIKEKIKELETALT